MQSRRSSDAGSSRRCERRGCARGRSMPCGLGDTTRNTAYVNRAKADAQKRVQLAGRRLAKLINDTGLRRKTDSTCERR